jgi:putative DNA primase/helicase
MKLNLIELDDRTARDLNSRELGERTDAECDVAAIDQDRVAELAALSNLEYERQRHVAAKEMGIRASALDAEVKRKRPRVEQQTDEQSIFPDREMWPEPVTDIDAVLDDAAALILRHMAMDKHWGDVTALWCLYTYAVDCFNISPRYAAQSPTPECGKTTLLNVIYQLANRPLKTANIQAAGVFRVIELYSPTLIIDEGDTFLHDNDTLRGVLNSGHSIGDNIIRVEGDPLMPKAYKVFGACAFGSIKELPATLQSRSIVNRLRRATAAEAGRIHKFRADRPPAECGMIAAMFARWADDNRARLVGADPDMSGMFNRQEDNWRPLFAIADLAGGKWPRRVQDAARKAVGIVDALPLNVELLTDCRRVICPPDRDPMQFIGSTELLKALVALDSGSRPWADWKGRGKEMSAKALADMLGEFGVRPGQNSQGTSRGYAFEAFADAFTRYLTPQCVKASETQQNQAKVEFSMCQTGKASDTLKSARSADEIRLSDTLTHWRPDSGSIDDADRPAAYWEDRQ